MFKFKAGNSVNINNHENRNPDPPVSIYPSLLPGDAVYSLREEDLRSAIFMPTDFKFGNNGKTPVILVPGTGSYGGEAFEHNFAKLLKNSSFADPVWLNVPGRMCDASTKNAEHVAYAINYIATKSNRPVTVIAWSQGNLSTQWSLKYWPSTRKQVNNFICLSADFRGTINAWGLCPVPGTVPGTPAVWAQTRNSKFIATLRSNGGDSAYVPTTSIYSQTDEVVQPQFGSLASALMKDERQVGVMNCEVQVHGRFMPAGLAYSHEGIMYHPLAWALTEDAIINGGPGKLDRLNLRSICMHRKAPGLSLLDATQTQALSAWCLKSILTFTPKPWREPELPLFAAMEETTYTPEEIDAVIPPKPALAVVGTETAVAPTA